MLDRYLEPDAVDDMDPKTWMTDEELEELYWRRMDSITHDED